MPKKGNHEENVPGLGQFWESMIHERYEMVKFLYTTGPLLTQRKLRVLISNRHPRKEMLLNISIKGIAALELDY